MTRFLYPQNLKAQANMWLWGMRDFIILAICALLSVVAAVELGWLIPAAGTLCFGFLTIRKDDNPDTVKDRLTVYHAQTEPLIEYYEKAGLLRKINGLGDTAEIAANFLSAM